MAKDLSLLFLLFVYVTVDALEMTVDIDNTNTIAGDDVKLTCRIKKWESSEIVRWYKEVLLPESKKLIETVSTKGNVEPPYKGTGRYEVTLEEDGEDGLYNLIIKGVTSAETGIYICTTAQDTDVTAQAVLTVHTPPSEMQLMHGNVKLADGATVTVMEGVAENFTCLSNGSIPASQMSVSVGDRVITDHFMSDSALYGHCTEAQGSGKSCIIHATHSKTLTSISGYVPQYEDDGKELVCRSSIQEVGDRLPVKSVKANIVVNFTPKIICQLMSDYGLHIPNVRIECKVESKPGITKDDVVWSWQHGDDTVHLLPGEKFEDISAMFQAREGHESLVTLKFDQLKERHFEHHYTLNVTNALGSAQESIKLKMKAEIKTTTPKTGESINRAGMLTPSTSMLLAIVFVFARIVTISL